MDPQGLFRVGVAGWQSQEWGELRNGFDRPKLTVLEVLARFVDVIEIDSTRAGPLKPEIAHVWLRRTEANPRLRFNPILGRVFTHDRNLRETDVLNWMDGVRPFHDAGKLGCVIMEFPWAFRYTKENRAFFIELRRTFHEFPLVAEFRHESWTRDEAVGTLKDFRVGFVNQDQPKYFRGTPPTALLTASVGYVRLHGRSGVDWFRDFSPATEREPYAYSVDELREWVERAKKLAPHTGSLFLTCTEPAEFRGLLHALQTKALAGDSERQVPPELLRRHWDELSGFSAIRPVQGSFSAPMQAVA